jgi:c-di-GMP-binding flagellar brake protein YcgR
MTENIRFNLLETDDFARYVLDGVTDIVFYLRGIKERKANVSLYAGRSSESFLTAVLDIDEARGIVVLDAPRDDALLEKALKSSPLVCLTSLEKVKVQFMVPRCSAAQFDGGAALEIPLPTRILRLQRRDYYRLAVPSAPRLRCLIPASDGHGNSNGRLIESTIVDISGGGLAVVAPPSSLNLTVGGLIEHCQITLPEVGTLVATLQVRNLFRVAVPGGSELRAGCQFVDLPAAADALIQRYIMRVEKTRTGGLRQDA